MEDLFKECPKIGEAVCCTPDNQKTELDATTPIGGCSGLYYSMTFQLPKWGYKLKKIDENLDVSPIYAEAYGLVVEQKHKLEAQIKEGLRSAAQAVADFELIRHDFRKYREILDFWKKGKEDDHILRSLFIDRVDAFVGENFSMISLVKRWPTLISDFIRLAKALPDEKEQDDVDKVQKALNVTKAEAHVLKTKNILYKNWKESFFPEVKDRYARIKNLMQARKRSVEDYREWLKPYVARYKVMEEGLEKKPSKIIGDPYMAPGFGNSLAASSVRFFAWQPFYPPEVGKPQRMKFQKLDPVDKFVMRWAKKIEEKYNVKMDLKRVKGIRDDAFKSGDLRENAIYYILFDITADKTIIKIPKGSEIEDMVIKIKHWIMSQNVVLLFLVEMAAKEEEFERYVNEIIGTKEEEEKIRKEVEKEFADPVAEKEPRLKPLKDIGSGIKKVGSGTASLLAPLKPYVVKQGPYETSFKERIAKSFMIPMGANYFAKLVKFLKWKMGVPGMPEEY